MGGENNTPSLFIYTWGHAVLCQEGLCTCAPVVWMRKMFSKITSIVFNTMSPLHVKLSLLYYIMSSEVRNIYYFWSSLFYGIICDTRSNLFVYLDRNWGLQMAEVREDHADWLCFFRVVEKRSKLYFCGTDSLKVTSITVLETDKQVRLWKILGNIICKNSNKGHSVRSWGKFNTPSLLIMTYIWGICVNEVRMT